MKNLTQAELLQVLISNAVEKGIRAAVQEELKPIKEELSKVKLIAAKILKEGAAPASPVASFQEKVENRIPQLRRLPSTQTILENTGLPAVPEQDMYVQMKKSGVGAGYSPQGEGNLPDIDIPVPFIKRKL